MKIRLLSRLEKSVLEKFRKPSESLLFSIILFKIIFFYKEEKENEENENNLNFQIIDERNENIKRFINVNYLRSLS